MKAIEYAAKFNNAQDKEAALNEIARDFLIETQELVRKRNPQSDAAGKAIIMELSDKWRAFAARTGLVKDGYLRILKAEVPEIAEWI